MIFHAKTQPAPPCLAIEKVKKNGSYRCMDALQQLKIDFKNKCYICEQKEPSAINIEHFTPYRGDKNLKFDWDNLFYCCAHCNNTKLDKAKYDSILNCTIETDNVDSVIRYKMNPFPKEKAEITAITDDLKVHNTVHLLLAVYNGVTPLKRIESGNLRNKLLKEIRAFQAQLCEFYEDDYSEEEKNQIKNNIIRALRPSSNFTAFKKWIIRDNEVMAEDFAEYV